MLDYGASYPGDTGVQSALQMAYAGQRVFARENAAAEDGRSERDALVIAKSVSMLGTTDLESKSGRTEIAHLPISCDS